MCVTAGAGAGKTHTLVEKYIHLIESGVAVSEILALTFTEKAAAEMKHRVRTSIMKLQGEEWEWVKEEINWCKISTFHAFCVSVIKEFPLETGVPPSFHVLEEVEKEELLGEALDRLLSPPLEPDVNEALVRLLSDMSMPKLASSLQYLYDRRSEMFPFLNSFTTKDELLARWSDLACEGRRRSVPSFIEDEAFMGAVETLRELAPRYSGGKDSGCKYLDLIAPLLDDISTSVPAEETCKAISELGKVKGSKNGGSKPVFGQDLGRFRDAVAFIQEALKRHGTDIMDDGAEDLNEGAAAILLDMKLVFDSYKAIISELKRDSNAIDFEDMIAIVHDLFERDPAMVVEEFTSRYRYILVDEFQDTDAIQSDIIWRMAGKENAKERLFIVGDPKQSIYLFRNVDVSMFKDFQGRIDELLEGRSIHLDTNYRSSPQVIDFVNHVFGQLMGEARKRWEFQYQEMRCCDARKDDQGSVELLLLSEEGGSEAEFIARRIQNMVEMGTREIYWSEDGKTHLNAPRKAGYGDIAILLRAKTRLHDFEDALTRYGIPYRVHGGLGFFERQEIIDLSNLLSFLSDEDDDLSLYGVLRSPYFSFSDEQLFHMLGRRNGSLWNALAAYAAGEEDERVRCSVRRLNRWLHYAPRSTVPQLLNMVYRESGIFAVYGALDDGELMIANLEKLLSMVRNAHSSGFLSLSEFKRWMQLSMEAGAKEGLAQLAGGEGSVKIMTVHAAKGLEFPIVFVPEMNFFRGEDSSLLLFSEDAGIGVDAPDPGDGHKLKATLPKKIIAHELDSKASAERKRLLYVALTRAKDHLVMCGSTPNEKEQEKELWINWILQAAAIGVEDISAGEKVISPQLSLGIVQDPGVFEAEEREMATGSLLDPEEMSAFIVPRAPIDVAPSKTPLSPSQISHERKRTEASGRVRTKLPEIVVKGELSCLNIPTVRGTIIHEILSGKDASVVLRKYGITDDAKVRELSGMYDRLMSEPMMTDAKAVYRELAFMAKVDGEVYKGRIDLLLQNEDGSWLVVDHKTGRFDGEIGDEKLEDYRLQMEIYEKAIAELMKRKVGSSLWLVDEERTLTL
jgi:ATP-dependent helicase/nuclease subunit A